MVFSKVQKETSKFCEPVPKMASFIADAMDSGEKVTPELLKGRDLDDVRPGVLGIHFIRRAFDVAAYDEKKKKGNRLRLVKYLKEE